MAQPFLTTTLLQTEGPFVGVSDYERGVTDQIRAYVPGTYLTLGTDGFGFSDTRPAARRFFNVDASRSWRCSWRSPGTVTLTSRYRRSRRQVPDHRRVGGTRADQRPRQRLTLH